jgi:hypothetical protein
VVRASTGVIHCILDQIPNLQNCFTNPKQKPRRGGGLYMTDKHLSIFKKSRHLGLESISNLVHVSACLSVAAAC